MDDTFPRVNARRTMGTGKKIAIGSGAATLALLAGMNYTIAKRNELPNITIPVTPPPSPNAYPLFVGAANRIKDSKAIGYAISNRSPAKPGASAPPASAAAENHVYTLAEKANIVRENQDALVMLRQGFAYGYANPPARSLDAVFPQFAKFREMARLLTLESQVKSAEGDWNGATNSDLDAVEMGVMMPRDGALIADLVGIACEAIGRRRLWDDYKHLDAAQSLAALRRMEKIEAKRFSFAECMVEEKRYGQSALLEQFRNPQWVPAQMANDTEEAASAEPNTAQKWVGRVGITWIGRRVIFENYTRHMDQIIQDARKPYGLHLPPPPAPTDPINQISAGVFDKSRLRPVQSETENRLLAVSFALQVYRQSQGVYPPSLDAIAANVPANLLTDPFATQGNLRYRRDGAKYVLYSVGPDGRDDGGRPIYDQTKPLSEDGGERARYLTQQDSVGDVVADVNQ